MSQLLFFSNILLFPYLLKTFRKHGEINKLMFIIYFIFDPYITLFIFFKIYLDKFVLLYLIGWLKGRERKRSYSMPQVPTIAESEEGAWLRIQLGTYAQRYSNRLNDVDTIDNISTYVFCMIFLLCIHYIKLFLYERNKKDMRGTIFSPWPWNECLCNI